jgi:hypothetical protein
MSRYKGLFILIILIFVGCKDQSTGPDNNETNGKVVVEGTVYHFMGSGKYPPGFQLVGCKWITACVDTDTYPYISGIVDSSYINKDVRAIGILDTITYGYNPPGTKVIVTESYLDIKIEQLQIIN